MAIAYPVVIQVGVNFNTMSHLLSGKRAVFLSLSGLGGKVPRKYRRSPCLAIAIPTFADLSRPLAWAILPSISISAMPKVSLVLECQSGIFRYNYFIFTNPKALPNKAFPLFFDNKNKPMKRFELSTCRLRIGCTTPVLHRRF